MMPPRVSNSLRVDGASKSEFRNASKSRDHPKKRSQSGKVLTIQYAVVLLVTRIHGLCNAHYLLLLGNSIMNFLLEARDDKDMIR